jgi:hypothetical protein
MQTAAWRKKTGWTCSSPAGGTPNRHRQVSEAELDAAGIARIFNEHGVEYVVIGAYAAIAQKAPIPATRDIDFTPEASLENLDRLSRALKALGARIRTDAVEGGLVFSHDGASLGRSEMWNLVCNLGEFDIAFRPAAFKSGYSALVSKAHKVIVDGVLVTVADLDDVILSKETAGRPKDLRILPILYRFSAEKRAGES